MKSEKNILFAFLLNLLFSAIELVGGLAVGSVAILSDSLHDLGDAISIGVAYLFERKSNRPKNDIYTYGYGRYSLVGALFTALVLILGSVAVCVASIRRLSMPEPINYDGMILIGIIGVTVNFIGAYATHGSDSVNERAVSLHMLEDVLGWIVVLIGACVMRFTDLYVLDPLMSFGVAVFILIHALKNLIGTIEIFTDRAPRGICVSDVERAIEKIEGVIGVHHIHLRSMTSGVACASMHVVVDGDSKKIKNSIREVLGELRIEHVTLELEEKDEECVCSFCSAIKQENPK